MDENLVSIETLTDDEIQGQLHVAQNATLIESDDEDNQGATEDLVTHRKASECLEILRIYSSQQGISMAEAKLEDVKKLVLNHRKSNLSQSSITDFFQ